MSNKKELEEYKSRLQELSIKSIEAYDKAVMTLSGGALAISFTFIKDIIGDDPIQCKCFLILAWSSWAFSILCVLISLFSSHMALEKAFSNINKSNVDSIVWDNLGGNWDMATKILNVAGGLLFIAGTIFLISFVSINVN